MTMMARRARVTMALAAAMAAGAIGVGGADDVGDVGAARAAPRVTARPGDGAPVAGSPQKTAESASPAASGGAAQERPFTLRGEHVVTVRSTPPFYAPNTLRLQVGDIVRWVNPAASDRHSVRETERAAFAFDLAPGEDARVTVRRAGTYRYQCRFHPWMSGTITVEARHLPIAWMALPSGLAHGRMVRAPEGRSAVIVGAGERPLVARLTIGSDEDADAGRGPLVREVGTIARAVRTDVPPVLASDGGLWFVEKGSVERGLVASRSDAVLRFDTKTRQSTRRELEGARIVALAAAESGAADDGAGVWAYDAAASRVRRITMSGGASAWRALGTPSPVARLVSDGRRGLWLLLASGGLARYDPERDALTVGPPATGAIDPSDLAAGHSPIAVAHVAADAAPASASTATSRATMALAASDGVAWLLSSTGHKLFRFDGSDRAIGFASGSAGVRFAQLELASGTAWLADSATGHLARLQDGALETVMLTPAAPRVRSFVILRERFACLMDEEGRIGIADIEGLSRHAGESPQ